MALGCSTRVATRGHISAFAFEFLCSCHRVAHILILHWYYICRVLVTLYILFEVSAGLILSNAAHTMDTSHSVWTSLFPGQSKLPAALANIPLFSLASCEFSSLLDILHCIVLHWFCRRAGCKGCDLNET